MLVIGQVTNSAQTHNRCRASAMGEPQGHMHDWDGPVAAERRCRRCLVSVTVVR